MLFFNSICICTSCTEIEQEPEFIVQLNIPESVTLALTDREMTFRVMFSQPPLQSDMIILKDPSGLRTTCRITSVSDKSVSFELYEGMVSGDYDVYVKRGEKEKRVGKINIQFVYNSEVNTEIVVKDGNNVYGIVSCGDKGIPGVVVSDGYEVVTTDSDGVYQFRSAKKHKYVFISVPSGYEAISDGVFPKLHQQLVKGQKEQERIDFPLIEAPGQENHTMLFFGDLHMAARTSDASQFSSFVTDVNSYLAENSGKKIYAMTLGDMTWELYWVSNKYAFDEYITDINRLRGIQVFNTIGNHDHDMAFAGDFDTVTKYKKSIAPTYYSFNIGKVHYVVLDDIECMNTGANTSDSRNYVANVVQEQLEWLKKDLEHVSKSTPIVVTMHSPLYNDKGKGSLNNTSALESILSAYPECHVWTGHTHKMYNVDNLSTKNIFEHNAGAVCATWWWTGHLTSGNHIAQDGAPGGYTICNVSGDEFQWQFKGTGRDINYQFRSYDRNSISLTSDKYMASNASASNIKAFTDAAGEWVSSNTENYVYLNVWNYDPLWSIEVKEGNQNLKVEQVSAKDPLHLISYNAKKPTGGFGTSVTRHLFRVKASSATSTLTITVKDRFGNIYSESMKRPKEFTIQNYK